MKEWEVQGWAFSRAAASSKLLKVDLTNAEAVRSAVFAFRPHVIVHSAAERRPEVVEKQKEKCAALNVDATKTIAESAAQVVGRRRTRIVRSTSASIVHSLSCACACVFRMRMCCTYRRSTCSTVVRRRTAPLTAPIRSITTAQPNSPANRRCGAPRDSPQFCAFRCCTDRVVRSAV